MVYLTCAVIGLGGRGVIKTRTEVAARVRLYMLTSDLTFLVPPQFSHWLQVRNVGTVIYSLDGLILGSDNKSFCFWFNWSVTIQALTLRILTSKINQRTRFGTLKKPICDHFLVSCFWILKENQWARYDSDDLLSISEWPLQMSCTIFSLTRRLLTPICFSRVFRSRKLTNKSSLSVYLWI